MFFYQVVKSCVFLPQYSFYILQWFFPLYKCTQCTSVSSSDEELSFNITANCPSINFSKNISIFILGHWLLERTTKQASIKRNYLVWSFILLMTADRTWEWNWLTPCTNFGYKVARIFIKGCAHSIFLSTSFCQQLKLTKQPTHKSLSVQPLAMVNLKQWAWNPSMASHQYSAVKQYFTPCIVTTLEWPVVVHILVFKW